MILTSAYSTWKWKLRKMNIEELESLNKKLKRQKYLLNVKKRYVRQELDSRNEINKILEEMKVRQFSNNQRNRSRTH